MNNRILKEGKVEVPEEYQNLMDQITVEFCDTLYIVNGFVTEIFNGHVEGILKETEA